MMEFGFLSIKHALRFLVKKGNWKLTLIYLEIQFVVFRSQGPIGISIDQSELQNLLQQSLDCLYEIPLSNLAYTFSLASPESVRSSGNVTDSLDGFTSGDISPSKIATENSNLHSLGLNQGLGFVSNNLEPASSHWLVINISVGEVFFS